jgi:hypothetical protein
LKGGCNLTKQLIDFKKKVEIETAIKVKGVRFWFGKPN